jgi:hypothetical protein
MGHRLTKTIVLLIAFSHASAQVRDTIHSLPPISLGYNTCKNPELFILDYRISLPQPKQVNKPQAIAKAKNFLIDGEFSFHHFSREGNAEDITLLNSRSDIAVIKLNIYLSF